MAKGEKSLPFRKTFRLQCELLLIGDRVPVWQHEGELSTRLDFCYAVKELISAILGRTSLFKNKRRLSFGELYPWMR